MTDQPKTPAQVVETHISVLVFVGDTVYKIRKRVHFDFLDFTDRAAREADCRREVELNSRLAPDICLGVADIVMNGEAIDHMVVMRTLPAERRLATLVRTGADLGGPLQETAMVLSAFHAGANRSPAISAVATQDSLEGGWQANFDETGRFVGTALETDVDRDISTLLAQWFQHNGELIASRISEGQICDGHGDLQAEDVFCLDGGVRILDCIEFSDLLRYGDVCADVAFLAMDLERLGSPGAARQFVFDYELQSRELPRTLLHYYVAQRAYVRAKVTCLRLEQGVESARSLARQLHEMALRHLRLTRLALVLVGGLPGTGKSTLAAGMAAETGWALLRSDVVRSGMQPVEAGTRVAASDPDHGRYAPQGMEAVYAELSHRAQLLLERGVSAILDASWIHADQRDVVRGIAEIAQADVVEIRCICDRSVSVNRIRKRRGRADDASEATDEIRDYMADRMYDWPSASDIDTSRSTESDVLTSGLDLLAQ